MAKLEAYAMVQRMQYDLEEMLHKCADETRSDCADALARSIANSDKLIEEFGFNFENSTTFRNGIRFAIALLRSSEFDL